MKKRRTSGIGPVKKLDQETAFFERIKKILFEKLAPDFLPEKLSRWAGVGPGFRYYHFWYDRYLWDNWNLSYKVWLFDKNYNKKERREKIGIYLEYNSKFLMNKGVPESVINRIHDYLSSLRQNDFNFNNVNYSFFLEKYYSAPDFRIIDINPIVDDLAALIKNTRDQIDRMLSEID